MAIKKIVTRQYRDIAQQALGNAALWFIPKEGWICTVRKAFGMSGVQLAQRLGVTKAWVYRTEKAELSGGVTLKTMQRMAEAMGCRFVYAIMPNSDIETFMFNQAKKKAASLVKKTNTQMALEAQALSEEQIAFEIDRLARDMVQNMPSDFWDDK